MIIKRDIMLKVIWAYHGKCGEARNNSGDKIFKKDVFDSIMEIGISAERAVYSYLIHKKFYVLKNCIRKMIIIVQNGGMQLDMESLLCFQHM